MTNYNLTPREREVLNLLKKPFKQKYIASILHISETTLKCHICNIYRKYNTEQYPNYEPRLVVIERSKNSES